MRSFKQYITEIGDGNNPYKWEYKGLERDGQTHAYHISHPTNKDKDTLVRITHEYPDVDPDWHDPDEHIENQSAEVNFTRIGGDYEQTHDMSTGEAVKTFSTIKRIMAQHAQEHPSISHYKFTAEKREARRNDVYGKFAKRAGGGMERGNEILGYNTYHIPAGNL